MIEKDAFFVLGITSVIKNHITEIVDLVINSSDIYHYKNKLKLIEEDLNSIDEIIKKNMEE